MQQSKRTANEWNVRSDFFFDLVWVGCLFVCLVGLFVGLVWFGLVWVACLFTCLWCLLYVLQHNMPPP